MLQNSISARAPAGNGPGWTDARVDLLKALWADGLSASVIAAQLGEVTRNAVIGKVHRLGIQGRAATRRQPRRTMPRRNRIGRAVIRKPAFVRPSPVPPPGLPPAPAALMLSIAQLTEATCHWPIGDPRQPGFGFCGARRTGRQPYCGHHQAIGHSQKRRRA